MSVGRADAEDPEDPGKDFDVIVSKVGATAGNDMIPFMSQTITPANVWIRHGIKVTELCKQV